MSNRQITVPDENEIGMINVEALAFTGDYAKRSKRFLAQAFQDIVPSEHAVFSRTDAQFT